MWLGGLIWFTGLIPTNIPTTTRETDAIVVLTGGSERLRVGLDELASGRARKLFVSGVYRGVEVVELLRLTTESPEQVQCCVVLGYTADNTAGNASETAAWMASEGYGSLRIVTASYHMPRSLTEFRHAMPDATVIPHPVFPDHVKVDEWWLWPGTVKLIISEYHKYMMALLRHRISPGPNHVVEAAAIRPTGSP